MMAEEEEHFEGPSTSEERPQTARKVSPQPQSRKVPGGFGIDDLDDLSPDKNEFEDSIFTNAQAHEQNSRIPSLDPATLPSLPPPGAGDSSLIYNHSEDGGNGSDAHMDDALDEEAMQRHLNNVESSFMPVASPISIHGKKGADDTYLFDGAQPPARGTNETSTPSKSHAESTNSEYPPVSPPTPANAYKTPGPGRESSEINDTSDDVGNNTSSLETMSSSPTAAAAARTVSRAISMAGGHQEEDDTSFGHSQEDTDNDLDVDATPRKKKNYSSSSDGRSTVRHVSSNQSLRTTAADAGNTPGAALLGRKSSGKRHKYLRGRHSHTSSVSSFVTTPDDESDVAHGADYALQSGGAVPAEGFSRNGSMALSRSISLGSMASGIEDMSGSTENRLDGSLATLTEEEQNRDRRPTDISPPETPRVPSSRTLAAPTDTIIARHVRNVQVPDSVAQEYRNKNGVSEKRSGFAVSTLGRNGKNLTLKEQSSTIERLSKENFDLKLKVMFLSDRLDKLSEEGVKEMISENVELKTGLAVMQRDNKALKRKIKELEKQLKDDEERPSTARSGASAETSPQWFDQEGAQEREEELLYLRERVEEYMTEIEKMRNESMTRENEKRNLAEVVRQMGERRGQNVEAREEMDVWKDLLEQETSRREQADEDNKKLREDIFRMKTETSSNSGAGLTHTTNIYNITKKRQISPSRPRSEFSDRFEDRNGNISAASTLVEEVRKECEQLRHENAELRREVGAQTSMLTSRNREKERLYQEIEDLKLGQRRGGGSVAGDSIFERSASRAHVRSASRASADTRQSLITDTEREDLEDKHAELRDRINALKIKNQDLQRELSSCTTDFETAVEQKKEAEALALEYQEALEVAENDLVTMQTDRDEALQGQEELENNFESLKQEAQETLDELNAELDESNAEIERLQTELTDTTENFNALQNEMRLMSQALVRLEDDHENKTKRIQELEQELDEANKELEQMENNLVSANDKINRLSVQQENLQGELEFMREDQDGDKLKIGELELTKRKAEETIQNLRSQIEELEQRLQDERQQSEMITDNREREVQQYINNLNRENAAAKDENRQLHHKLKSVQGESAERQQRLDDLDNNVRVAMGCLHGTKFDVLSQISQLTRDYDNSCRELDSTKASLAEKERIIKQRDSLLESHALESRKLADMLDKERQTHRNTKHQFETFQKTQQHTTRTLTQQESRVLELETARAMDRRKIATLENNLKDQMNERNQLLLALWNRLSTLCGSDWAHNNSLINGRALPSLEAVSNMLPGFAKNLLAAVKTIETLIGDFRSRIRSVEKDLWKEYQTLETNLEVRTKRLDRLETMARSGIPGLVGDNSKELNKLKEVNRTLKAEISTLRAANDVRAGVYDTSPSPSVPTGPRNKSRDKSSRTSTMTRHQSASTVETFDRVALSRSGSISSADKLRALSPEMSEGGTFKPDLRWQIRLQELEYKLKAEREARLVDRSSARQRLEEKNRENAELAAQVERNRVREEMGR